MSCKTFPNYLPCLLVLTVISWSYYAYIIEFCLNTIENSIKRTFFIIIYHFLLIMVLWSFIQTMLQDNDLVPVEYRLTVMDHARLLTFSESRRNSILIEVMEKRQLKIYTRTDNGLLRYCKICRLLKPDRTHHCSTCKVCVLKMDHHCPWINNCVGFANYKPFVLLLLNGSFYCMFFIGTSIEYLIDIWSNFNRNLDKIHITIGFGIACIVGILMLSLFFYHVRMILRNETTIESIQDLVFENELITFDVGKWHNFAEIFGNNFCLWIIPIYSGMGNGYAFNVKTII